MKNSLLHWVLFTGLLLCSACSNTSGSDISNNNTSQRSTLSAKIAFVNGYLSTWIDDNGNLIDESDFEDDSGRLSYKWYRENPDNGNQEEIYGWTESYYEYDSSLDRNKILVSKITYDGKVYEAKSEKILGIIDDASFDHVSECYEGEVLSSDELYVISATSLEDEDDFDESGMSISYARVENISETDEEVLVAFDLPCVEITSTCECSVVVRKPGYSSRVLTFSVTASKEFEESEVPKLSTQKEKITRGCVVFEDTDFELDYKVDGSWVKYSEGKEISVNNNTSQIFVRKSATGEPGDMLYIKESEGRAVPVTKENVGTDVSRIPPVIKNNIDTHIQNEDISIFDSTTNEGNVFLASISNSAINQDEIVYEWVINGKNADTYRGVQINGNSLVISYDSDVPRNCTVDIEVFAMEKNILGLFYYIHAKYEL